MNTLDQTPDHWIDTVWWRTCERLRAEMSPQRFAFWISPLRISAADEQRVVIACRSPYFREQTFAKFGTKITDLIAEYAPKVCAVDFVADPTKETTTGPVRPRVLPDAVSANGATPTVASAKPAPTPGATGPSKSPATQAGDGALGERRILIEDIKKKVAEYYATTLVDLESPSRKRALVRQRQVAMLLARELSGRSFPEIARRFGDRDHTTVIHGCKKIRLQSETDPLIAAQLEELRRSIMH